MGGVSGAVDDGRHLPIHLNDHEAGMNGASPTEAGARPPAPEEPKQRPVDGPSGRAGRLDLISCDGCGRTFTTQDGPGMLTAIKGACPDCGGQFHLAGTSPPTQI